MSRYGGKNNSVEKTRVRAIGYGLCGKRLWNKYHIVIASTDLGDIKFLQGHGVSRIIACDTDVNARELARGSGVVISNCDRIEDTVIWAHSNGYKIGSINVDLCNTMPSGAPVLATVYKTVKRIGIQCVLMYTFQRGRDAIVLNRYPSLAPDDARAGDRTIMMKIVEGCDKKNRPKMTQKKVHRSHNETRTSNSPRHH